MRITSSQLYVSKNQSCCSYTQITYVRTSSQGAMASTCKHSKQTHKIKGLVEDYYASDMGVAAKSLLITKNTHVLQKRAKQSASIV